MKVMCTKWYTWSSASNERSRESDASSTATTPKGCLEGSARGGVDVSHRVRRSVPGFRQHGELARQRDAGRSSLQLWRAHPVRPAVESRLRGRGPAPPV